MSRVAERSIRQYESALAQELGDGHARLRDLKAAALELSALGKLLARGERAAIHVKALYCTAALRYRRFFISSSQQSRDLIQALEPQLRQRVEEEVRALPVELLLGPPPV